MGTQGIKCLPDSSKQVNGDQDWWAGRVKITPGVPSDEMAAKTEAGSSDTRRRDRILFVVSVSKWQENLWEKNLGMIRPIQRESYCVDVCHQLWHTSVILDNSILWCYRLRSAFWRRNISKY